MTNQHNNNSLESRLAELEETVADIKKLCHWLFNKKKNIQKKDAVKNKIREILKKNIEQNNSRVQNRINKK